MIRILHLHVSPGHTVQWGDGSGRLTVSTRLSGSSPGRAHDRHGDGEPVRRLLAEGGAEQSSVRMAADLLRDGEVRDLDENIWALTEAGVAAAFRSFGDARILRLGPDLGLSGR